MHPPIVPAPSTNPPSALLSPSPESYLNERFPTQKTFLQNLALQNYGVAYRHCLTERTLRTVADDIGIVWPMKGTVKSKTFADTGLTIKLDDLTRWVGINPGSFKNIRASVAKARVAREHLRRQSIPSLDKKDASAANILKVLLTGNPVEYPGLENSSDMEDGEWDAIRMTGDSLDKLVKRVIEKFGSDGV
jgi:hypothetical protein